MRLPRVRFTVRRMMVAVVIAALLLFGAIEGLRMGQTARAHRARQARHAFFVKRLVASLADCRRRAEAEERAARDGDRKRLISADEASSLRSSARWWRANEANLAARLAYHEALGQKYARAARYPWRVVPPDPREPYWDGFVRETPEEEPGPASLLSNGEAEALGELLTGASRDRPTGGDSRLPK